MAKVKYLADADNNKIYPVGHTRAVYDDNGTLLEDRLTSDEQKIATEATERKNADNTKVNISGGDVSKTVVSFTQSSTRTDITSGDTVSTLFGKIKKWFADLKTVAWTGNYSDLTNRPSLAPSNAERNVIVGIQKNGADITPDSSIRKVNITVPTTASDIGAASSSHTHTKANITDFPTSMTPTSHASTGTTYGKGDNSYYGHLKLSDNTATASGTNGDDSGTIGDALIIGNVSDSTQSNAFRVAYSGDVYGKGSYYTTDADYAEFFEWLDGNSENADRTGLFVTLDGDKIRLANADDDYILGAISAAPGVIGNDHADTWQGMWLTDIFGRVLTHTVHHDAEYDDEGNLIHDACGAVEPIVNPDYNPDEKYIPREERPEWGIVGLMGQLIVINDGTCKVNGNCTVSDGGTATASDSGYRVIARLEDTHVKVLFRL